MGVLLQGEELTDRFLCILTDLAVNHCLTGETSTMTMRPGLLYFVAVDAYVRLLTMLITGTASCDCCLPTTCCYCCCQCWVGLTRSHHLPLSSARASCLLSTRMTSGILIGVLKAKKMVFAVQPMVGDLL